MRCKHLLLSYALAENYLIYAPSASDADGPDPKTSGFHFDKGS